MQRSNPVRQFAVGGALLVLSGLASAWCASTSSMVERILNVCNELGVACQRSQS